MPVPDAARARYVGRVSGPLLDRFDLRVRVRRPDVGICSVPANARRPDRDGEPSSVVAGRVARTRELARARGACANAELPAGLLDRFAPLSLGARRLLERRLREGRLSARGLHRVRRIALTVADLAGDGPVGRGARLAGVSAPGSRRPGSPRRWWSGAAARPGGRRAERARPNPRRTMSVAPEGVDGLPAGAFAAALAYLPGVGPAWLVKAIAAHGPRQAWGLVCAGQLRRPAPSRPGPAGAGLWAEAARRLDVGCLWARLVRAGIAVTWPGELGYPAALAVGPSPAGVLFRAGDAAMLDGRPCVAVVGTRRCTPEGAAVAYRLGYDLSEAGVRVVSGLALGIDGAAHAGALAAARDARAGEAGRAGPGGGIGTGGNSGEGVDAGWTVRARRSGLLPAGSTWCTRDAMRSSGARSCGWGLSFPKRRLARPPRLGVSPCATASLPGLRAWSWWSSAMRAGGPGTPSMRPYGAA